MTRFVAALLVLAACNPPPPPARRAPVSAPPAPVEATPALAAESPPAPKKEETAVRERKAQLAKKVAGQGVLGVIGSQGGGSIADVFKEGGSDALAGAGGVGIAQGSGGTGHGSGSASGIGSLGSKPKAAASEESEWPALQGIPVPTTRKFLGAPPPALKTLGEIARYLDSTLGEHGYEEVGYFRYMDGFAIATRPERIGGDATPVSDRRWPSARVAAGARSLQDLFEVNGVEGDRYRSFLFLCTSASDVDFQGGAAQSWGLWKTGSMNPEGDGLLARAAGPQKLYAFVYELSQDKEGKVLIATSSPNTAAQHLRGAGLVTFLR